MNENLPTIHIDGYELPCDLDEASLKAALKYKPRSDDVFICSYHRGGAQWIQQIVHLIYNKGQPLTSMIEFFTTSPCLEVVGLEYVSKMPRPGTIKAHLPFTLIPYSPEAKYIFVARNPRDTCVSYYNYWNAYAKPENPGMSFDQFFEGYLKDNMYYGEYMKFLMSWYPHRNDKNVLFLTYENTRADPKSAVLKIASFLGTEYESMLKGDPDLMKEVMHHCDFETMKKMYNDSATKIYRRPCSEIIHDTTLPVVFKSYFKNFPASEPPFGDKQLEFMKNGEIGGWKSLMQPKHIERLDSHIAEKADGSDFLDLWIGLWRKSVSDVTLDLLSCTT